MSRVQATLLNIGREALRIVLPSWCIVCETPLPWRDRSASCCGSCWRSLPRLTAARCWSCALPLPVEGVCIACSTDPLPVDWCDAWGEYKGGLAQLLHAFKFSRHDFLDAPLAALMCETLAARGDLDFDVIVPVPMHWTKEHRRGYNQAALLGRALSKLTSIECDGRLMTKRRESETQSLLARAARRENVKKSFIASSRVAGKAVLLADDICTTGETFRACASELIRAGAARVSAISVAKAV